MTVKASLILPDDAVAEKESVGSPVIRIISNYLFLVVNSIGDSSVDGVVASIGIIVSDDFAFVIDAGGEGAAAISERIIDGRERAVYVQKTASRCSIDIIVSAPNDCAFVIDTEGYSSNCDRRINSRVCANIVKKPVVVSVQVPPDNLATVVDTEGGGIGARRIIQRGEVVSLHRLSP
jgi:hypothetical protein